jgi:hypothetical protein
VTQKTPHPKESTPLREFYDALTSQERRFIPHLASDRLGVILRCAVNELDWFFYNLSKTKAPTYEQQEQFYLLHHGVARLIQLSLDARVSFDVPTISFRRTSSLTTFVLEIASALGMIEHGRRVAQTVALGTGRIERVDENEFRILLPAQLVDEECLERSTLEHYQSESRRLFSTMMDSKRWKTLDADISAKLQELVHPFANHFIGYGADPLLDDYFFGIAYQEIQLQDGVDTFHYAIRFGDVCFQNYILALTFLMSLHFRHRRFAEALVDKEPGIKIEDILTITSETDGLVESIKDGVNHFGSVFNEFEKIDLAAARTIFEVLSCSRRNTSLLSAPGSPLPLLIQSSDQGVIRCLTGAYSEPIRMLLESLRHHFPKDYAKNQQSREQAMQRAVKRVLNDTFDALIYWENTKICLEGKIMTDIDLVVLEERTGCVMLCQLKHQEIYGHNLHSKHIRSERLKKQVSVWLGSLDKWVSAVDKKAIRDSLRLPKTFPEPSIYRLIISKHFSHPLRDICQPEDTAFSSWIEFFNGNALLKTRKCDRKLVNLIQILKEAQSPPQTPTHLPEPTTKWTVNELIFTTHQENDDLIPKK